MNATTKKLLIGLSIAKNILAWIGVGACPVLIAAPFSLLVHATADDGGVVLILIVMGFVAGCTTAAIGILLLAIPSMRSDEAIAARNARHAGKRAARMAKWDRSGAGRRDATDEI